MKNLFYALTVILFVSSCSQVSPSGEITTKDVQILEFENLDLKGKFKVFYVQNPKNAVSVETYPNIFENLDIQVKGKTLSIKEKRETQGVDFYNITLYGSKNISYIKISDSAEMNISSQLMVDHFNLDMRDHAKFIGSVLSNKANIKMAQKTRLNMLGKTLDAQISLQDTASIIAPYWYINNLQISSKNGTFAEMYADETLSGEVANTSQLIYYGEPSKKITQKDRAKIENKKLK